MKKILPLLVLGCGVLYLVMQFSGLTPPKSTLAHREFDSKTGLSQIIPGGFDLAGFGRLPVLMEGRLKPLDTVGRTSLLLLQGRQAVTAPDGRTLTPTVWLLDTLFRSDLADHYQVIEIVHPDVLALLGLATTDGAGGKRFSFAQLQPGFGEIKKQTELIRKIDSNERSPFQRAVMSLQEHLLLYHHLKYSLILPEGGDFLDDLGSIQKSLGTDLAAHQAKAAGKPYDQTAANAMDEELDLFQFMAANGSILAIPPADQDPDPNHWRNAGTALQDSVQTGVVDPTVLTYAGLAHAWHQQSAIDFNTIVWLYRPTLLGRFGDRMEKTDAEATFNAAEPFYHGMLLYVAAFLLAVFSWLKWPEALSRSALWLIGLTWVLTTGGILTRMWLEGRPPVTNLYSSALFIGWGAVALCLVLEVVFRNAIGSAAAGLIGFATLLIAHHLALSGDTLEMMRAVLDSNFWLGTHVVVVTTGYASTYLAGILALIYVGRGVFTRTLDRATAQTLAKMVYGIICFATLFSFVGTVLGGIWADQSWGRFWGWDSKENGALIIVLWNALILHARWGGMVRERGLMALALFGNIVTSWSWFGVNMLGIGLHSYGFIDKTFWWLIAFVASQLVCIALALHPAVKWRSQGLFPVRPPAAPRPSTPLPAH